MACCNLDMEYGKQQLSMHAYATLITALSAVNSLYSYLLIYLTCNTVSHTYRNKSTKNRKHNCYACIRHTIIILSVDCAIDMLTVDSVSVILAGSYSMVMLTVDCEMVMLTVDCSGHVGNTQGNGHADSSLQLSC